MMKASFGIDPGLTKTGMVAYPDADDRAILAWATFACTGTKNPDLARVLSLASCVVNEMLRWIESLEVQDLDIGIELPFLAKNPQGFAKQMRLVQEIESGIYYRIAPEVRECWVTEVYPKTSKLMACNYGAATKAEIIQASPFEGWRTMHEDWKLDTAEAIADAWAHGLCTWGGAKDPAARLNFTALRPAHVGEEYG